MGYSYKLRNLFSVLLASMFSKKAGKRHTEEEGIMCAERRAFYVTRFLKGCSRSTDGTVDSNTFLISYDLIDKEVKSEGVFRLTMSFFETERTGERWNKSIICPKSSNQPSFLNTNSGVVHQEANKRGKIMIDSVGPT